MADNADLMALQFMNTLPEQRRLEFQMTFQASKKDRTTALVLGLFVGYLGVDRFYLGQNGLGIAKLLTFGGCGVWAVVDWFLIMSATDRCNMDALNRLQLAYGALAPAPQFAPPGNYATGGYGPPGGGGYGPPPGGGGYGPPRYLNAANAHRALSTLRACFAHIVRYAPHWVREAR